MELKGIKDKLVDGVMNFDKKYYELNTKYFDYPDNYVFRFQWHRTGNRGETILFDPHHYPILPGSYLQLEFSYNNMQVTLQCIGNVKMINLYIPDILDHQYTQFAFYVSRHNFKIYYNGRLLKSVYGDFDLYQFRDVSYDVNQYHSSGYMKDLSLVLNVSEEQLSCLVDNSTVKACPDDYLIYNGQCYTRYNRTSEVENLPKNEFLSLEQDDNKSLYETLVDLFN